jgi:DNA polymerase-3 subunit beta
MKASVKPKALADVIDACAGIQKAKTTLPVLNAIRLTVVTADKLTVEASNLDQWLTGSAVCEAGEQGSLCVGAKMLSMALRAFGTESVNLTLNEQVLTLSQGKSSAKLPVLDGKEWPELPKLELKPLFELEDCAAFGADLEWVGKSVSTEESRYALMSIHMRLMDGFMVASDGRRAHKATIPQGVGVLNLPGACASWIVKLLAGAKTAELLSCGTFMMLKAGNWSFMTRLMEVEWPWAGASRFFEWESAKPESTFSRAELEGAVRSVKGFAGKSSSVKIACEAMGAIVSAGGEEDAGRMEKWIGGGGEISFKLDHAYLLDLISGGAEELKLRMADDMSPVQILNGGRHGVVMPMRGGKQ